MIQYIYFVKCPNCEDEHFDFFAEAKEFALGRLSQKPIITQIEVNRNDFGECTDSCDLGTVWSWEEMMKETDAEPAQSVFTKDDLKCITDGKDPEFDALDNSIDYKAEEPVLDEWVTTSGQEAAKQYIIKVSNNSDGYNYEGNGGRSLVRIDSDDLSIFSSLADAEASLAGYKKGSKAKIVEFADELRRKSIPEGMTLKELVEAMEENEDTVECAGCEELYPKYECVFKDDIGWLCSDCEDSIVKCTWCEELYDKSVCRKEVDLGWLCDRCEAAIKSRGETLTFREGNYWDFLDESIDDSKTLTDIVKDSINHLTNDIGKDSCAEDFADDVIADIENNYDIEVPVDLKKYNDWASAIACEVSRQVNNQYPFEEEIDELTEASLSDIANAINSEYGTSWNSADLLASTGIEDELGNIAYGINSEEPARKILDNRPLADIERFTQKYRKKKKAMVFNRKYRRYIQQFDDFPAIDPDTNELTYDKARKNEILDLVYKEHDAIIDKTRQAVARAREKAATRYKWTVEYTINGKTINRSTVLGDSTTPEEASQVLIDRIKGAEREALAFGEPFEWNGKVRILKCKKPDKTEEVFTEACEADIPSALKEGEFPEVSDSHLKFCPECGKNAFDTETGICVDCGFN